VRRGLGRGRGRNGHWGERGNRIGRNDGDGTCGDRGDRADLGRLAFDARCPCARHHHHGYAASRDHHAHHDDHAHPNAHHHHPVHRRSPSTGRDDDHHEFAADLCSVDPSARHSTMRQWVHERRDRWGRGERGHGNSVTLGDDVNADGRRESLMWSADDRPRCGCDADHWYCRHRGRRRSQCLGPVTALSGIRYGWRRGRSGDDAGTGTGLVR
jgi:hypothetical protein